MKPGDLVVIDCLYRLAPDGNEVAELAEVLGTIRRFAKETRCAILLVDHFRKAGADKARDRFSGSFIKQAGPETLIAIEGNADGVLTLNIDARTFHGTKATHTRFDLETYRFIGIPSMDIEAERLSKQNLESETWLLAIWKDRPLEYAPTTAEAAEAWAITRQAADKRIGKLAERGFLEKFTPPGQRAAAWRLTETGKTTVGSYMRLPAKVA